MGRKTKYSDELVERIIELYGKGFTDLEVCRQTDLGERTLNEWKVRYPQFQQAIKTAKERIDDAVEAALFSRAMGYVHPHTEIFCGKDGLVTKVETVKRYPPDTAAAIFWLKNRRKTQWKNESFLLPPEDKPKVLVVDNSFETFCTNANYPRPYATQVEMKSFAMEGADARLLLGARGYGKTDYCVILGVAEKIKLDPGFRVLIITKSKERNAAMLKEIANAAKANGVSFEKENSTSLRVTGLLGKDHSVSAVTLKTVTLRGRHPDLVIMDDPVTEDDVSEATRMHVERVYNEVNKLVGNILIIGQPAHQHDLYAKVRGLLRKLELPHGSIPELDHDLEAQRLAGVDESSIQASYFLKVVTEGTTPFDKIRYLEGFPPGDSVAFIDPSFEGGDYTALTIMRAHFGGVACVGFTFKKAWNHCLDEMVEKLVKYHVKRVCFETNSLGDQPLIMLRQALKSIGVVGKKSNGNKHSRIMSAGSYAHLIHMSRESDKIYQDQVVKYEYKAKHDDAPDSLASCLEWIGLIRGKL